MKLRNGLLKVYSLLLATILNIFSNLYFAEETITLKRGGEKGLGFSIAGGRGSTPYKDGDSVRSVYDF